MKKENKAFFFPDETYINKLFSIPFTDIDLERIQTVYEIFESNYVGLVTDLKFECIQRDGLVPRTNNLDFLLKFKNIEYQVGVDLPIFLTNDLKSNKTIFIVAEDPLRYFSHPQNGIILSTPFGIHIPENRSSRLKVYWEIIEHLIEMGFNVYLTDINKVWIKHIRNPKESIPGDLFESFKLALYWEIQTFNPELVIAFGNLASDSIKKYDLYDGKLLELPHPSPSANRKWKEVLNRDKQSLPVRCTIENKLAYMKERLGNMIKM